MLPRNLNGSDEEAAKRRAEYQAEKVRNTSLKRTLITVGITVVVIFVAVYAIDYLGIL